MINVLVTGSEGMLGKALIKSLRTSSIQAIGADIKSNENPLDITNLDDTSSVIKKIHPDIIIHTAAYTNVDGCEKTPEKAYAVNAEGTKNIAQAAKDIGSFLIYISTDYVFDGGKLAPYTEKDKPSPISVYGKSKLTGEEAMRDILDNYLIIRTSWLFGKGGKNFVDAIIEKAKSGQALKVVNDQTGCPTYTQDLAGAICKFLDSSPVPNLYANVNQQNLVRGQNDMPAILNITNSGSCSWYEFAKEIIKLKGINNVKIIPIKSNEANMPAKRPKMSVLDNSEYVRLTNKALPAWQDALKHYLGGNLN
jgi:dTDP-4-dehydrorhamnose reductase